MKKLLLLLLAVCLIIPVMAFTACDGDTPDDPITQEHLHQYADEWTMTEDRHYRASICEHTGLKAEDGAHEDGNNDGVCDICGYDGMEVHVHTTGKYVPSGESGHIETCPGCNTALGQLQGHIDINTDGLCDKCGYGERIPEPEYFTVTLQSLVGPNYETVATFDVEQNTVMTEAIANQIRAARQYGYGFAAWYTDKEFTEVFDYEAPVTSNIVIYGDRGNLAGDNIVWSYDEATKVLTLTGEGAMYDFENITVVPWTGLTVSSVDIDDTITTIGAYSFYVESAVSGTGMNLSAIELHEGLEKIGDYAFYGEAFMTEVKFPESLSVIGKHAFRACKGLTYIDIGGKNLTKVDESAFAQCSAAKYIIFNGAIEGSTNVFESCTFTHAYFAGNKGQFEAVEIGFGNLRLELAYLFYEANYEPQKAGPYWHRDETTGAPKQWCYSIYYIPSDGIKTAIYKDYVFTKNPVISQDNVDFRDNIWYDGYQFDGWTGNPTFAIGTTLTGDVSYTGTRGYKVGDGVDYSIADGTLTISGSGKMWDFEKVTAAPWYENSNFSNTDITEIVIQSNVTYIGAYAFCNFPKLESVEIKNNIVEMSTKAFYGCANLKYVYYYGNELEAMNCKGLQNQEETPNLTVYCKEMEGESISFLTAKGIVPTIRYWSDIVIKPAQMGGDGETVIEPAVTSRITWEYEDGVLTIGGEGVIPNYIDAFSTPWATTFRYIGMEPKLDFDSIEESVTSIVVREGITAIGNNAFNGLYNAASISIPTTVTRISATAFVDTAFVDNAENWTDTGLLIASGIHLLKVDAEKAGTRLLLPTDLATIAEGAFEGCSSIVELRLPKTLAGANELSYTGLDNLEKIFFHGNKTDWTNNDTTAYAPAVDVYFFSNRKPSGYGNYWKTLNNPTIWTDWLEPTETVANGDNTVTVTADDIALGTKSFIFEVTEGGTYNFTIAGATVEVYELGGEEVDFVEDSDTAVVLAAGTYVVRVTVSDLAEGEATLAIAYEAPEVDEGETPEA